MDSQLTAVLVDDEALALKRFSRLLEATGKVRILASFQDPVEAQEKIPNLAPDVLFLDINMPELTGFDLLQKLENPPHIVFTTAYSEFALRAFQENAIDYLLKPIETEALDRALAKLQKLASKPTVPHLGLAELLRQVAPAVVSATFPKRISVKLGDKIELVELASITHFYAKDKLTFAVTAKREHILEDTIQALETRLDPAKFFRIHRSTIVNLDFVKELHSWFAGKVLLRLNDSTQTELQVARERVKELRDKLEG
jgi:two-component system, LytTR family, response regulator